MYSEEDFDNAIRDGVLSDSAVSAFRKYIEERRNTNSADEEHFRFVQGFNDIFVSIASILLVICIAALFIENKPLIAASSPMLTSWGLAEYFTRQRRLALTSIVLVLMFIGGATALPSIVLFDDVSLQHYSLVYIGVFVSLNAYFHWKRFGVPITLACILGASAYGVIGSLANYWDDQPQLVGTCSLLLGILILTVAIYWDATDRSRTTKRSDIAFWLHVASSPLIVHGVYSYFDVFSDHVNSMTAIGVLSVYALLVVVSMTLDRRALMASSALYVLVVFTKILESEGAVSNGFAYIGAILGVTLLVLSVFWHPMRMKLVKSYPKPVQLILPN